MKPRDATDSPKARFEMRFRPFITGCKAPAAPQQGLFPTKWSRPEPCLAFAEPMLAKRVASSTEGTKTMDPILFDSWKGMAGVLLVGAAAYVLLLAFLRVSGKRTLSKMNAFDLIVTVALGSTLATALLDRSVPLAEAALAFALLIALQFAITWLSVRSQHFEHFIKASPTLLYHKGSYLEDAMRRQRVTRREIEAAARQAGHPGMESVQSVVLETDGAMSVLAR